MHILNLNKLKVITTAFNLLFSLSLIVDIVLKINISKEYILSTISYSKRSGGLRNRSTTTIIGIETDKEEYPLINVMLYNKAKEGDELIVYKTKIFKEVVAMYYQNKRYEYPSYSIYRAYKLFPIICVTLSVLSLLAYKNNHKYFEECLVVSVLFTIYLGVSMITNNIV